jgi:hypothetical protein
MGSYRRSYWKTVAVFGGLAMAGVAMLAALADLAWRPWRPAWPLGAWLAWSALVVALVVPTAVVALIATGGLVALRRDRLEELGLPYASPTPREAMGGVIARISSAAQRLVAKLRGKSVLCLIPGEVVEVRSIEQVLETLDAEGRLDGLRFMPEMARFCGQRLRVIRRVDKLNDYIWKRGLRRLHHVVMLEGVRCDGDAHGHCQTNCQLRWHEAWLARANRPVANHPVQPSTPGPARRALPVYEHVNGEQRFACQMTELTVNSTALSWRDPRVYAREWLFGNARVRPFLTGVSLALFGWVQSKRGGVGFPEITPKAGKTSPTAVLDLQVGEWVRIKSKHDIELTLNDRRRNRGLWFDIEMLRYCGGQYRVRSRIERVMQEKTGKLLNVANPCIVLEGVTATGEYLAFNAEHDQLFWRETWLERVEPADGSTDGSTGGADGWQRAAGLLHHGDRG